ADADGGCFADGGRRLPAPAAREYAQVLGPGLERGATTRALAQRLLSRLAGPVVLDAGAIDLRLLRSWHRLGGRPAAIVTPHHGEMAALLGREAAGVSRHAARVAAAFSGGWDLAGGPQDAATRRARPTGRPGP